MAKIGDYFKGNYFNAKALEDGPLLLTISHCEGRTFESKEAGKPDEQKMVVFFEEDDRALALNVTNWQTIGEIIGDEDTDAWPGHQIVLVRKKDRGIGGKMDWCVRVEAPEQEEQPRQQRQPQQPQATAQTKRAATAQQTRRAEPQRPVVDESDIPF
jgi:hypothetical protein